MTIWMWFLPLIAAFIGWITNFVAIKMLFHPKKPIKILGLTIQGIFIKRREAFAEKLGKLTTEELISFNDLEERMSKKKYFDQAKPSIEEHIDDFLKNKLTKKMPVISMFISGKTLDSLKTTFMEELDELFPVVIKKYFSSLNQEVDIESIVREKVTAFSETKLETVLFQIMSKEFRFVEIIGAVLGFIIGCVQVGLTIIMN